MGFLGQEANDVPDVLLRIGRHVVAVERQGARVDAGEPQQCQGQGGLAGAAAPHDGDTLPRFDEEVQAVQGEGQPGPVAHPQAGGLDRARLGGGQGSGGIGHRCRAVGHGEEAL